MSLRLDERPAGRFPSVHARGLCRRAAVFVPAAVALVATAAAAWAVPDPRFSLHSPVVVGAASGLAEPLVVGPQVSGQQGFVVYVRDVNNVPLYNRIVTLNFSLSGLRLQGTQDPGCTVDCATQVLSASTAANGWVVLHPRFGGFANGAAVEVAASGVVLGDVPARSTDMDAQDGATGLSDFAMFAPLFGSTTHPEADFDGSGGPIGLGDFAIFAREYGSGAQGAYCP